MKGSQVQAMEEDGIIEYDEARGEWVEVDEDGIFMYTIDRHDSDAEDLKREAAEDKPFDAMADAGMSLSDFR
jgi:hypothetical protein